MTRIMPSDEQYSEIDRLQTMIVILVNAELHRLYGTPNTFVVGMAIEPDVALPELRAIKIVVMGAMEKQLGIVINREFREVYGDFIDSLFAT